MGGRGSRGESMSAEKAKAAKETKKSMAQERRKSSVVEVKKTGRRQSTGEGGKGSFGTGRRKSGEASKESKMKQKKADETALRKNKVIYYIFVPKCSKCNSHTTLQL